MLNNNFNLASSTSKIESKTKSFLQKIEDVIFSIMHTILSDDKEIPVLYYILLFFQFLQFISFPFEPLVSY